MTIETKYDVGDAVYRVSEYGHAKDLIAAIKITGNKRQTIQYGFKSSSNSLTALWLGSDYSWYDEKALYTDEEEAATAADKLKAEREKKDRAKEEARLIERKAKLKADLEMLEQGIDPDTLEEDD